MGVATSAIAESRRRRDRLPLKGEVLAARLTSLKASPGTLSSRLGRRRRRARPFRLKGHFGRTGSKGVNNGRQERRVG